MVSLDLLVGTYHVVGDRLFRVAAYEVLEPDAALPPEYASGTLSSKPVRSGAPSILLRLERVLRHGPAADGEPP